MLKLFADILLFIVAVFLFTIFFIVHLLYNIFYKIFTKDKTFIPRLLTSLQYLFYRFALTIDKVGAYLFQDEFNFLFLKKTSKVRFGQWDKDTNEPYTVSKVLGLNYIENELNPFGFWFKEFLDLFEKEHILKAIENE